MKPVYIAASGHCSARGTGAQTVANSILAGEITGGERDIHGETFPYFRIPFPQRNWRERAQLAVKACKLAMDQVLGEADWKQVPFFFASSSLQLGELEEQTLAGNDELDLTTGAGKFANLVGSWMGVESHPWCFSTACTSSLTAIDAAMAMLGHGFIRHALVVTTELDNQLTANGFHSLGLLSLTQPRPFALDRDGLVLGEGVSSMLLTTDRGLCAPSCWRIDTCELGLDGYSATGTNPDGSAIADTMNKALDRSGFQPEEIELVKVHAAGAPSTDLSEASAIHTCFGDNRPPLVSLKPYFGHTLGASGLVELTGLLACLDQGLVPSTPGCDIPDPEIDLTLTATNLAIRPANVLFNSIGFGGGLATLILSRARV